MLASMRTLLTTSHSKFIHPSLALPCLAAYCGAECGELRIREFTVHEPKEHVLAALLAEAPDVVAFSVYLWNRRETLELVDALALVRPELRISSAARRFPSTAPSCSRAIPALPPWCAARGSCPCAPCSPPGNGMRNRASSPGSCGGAATN